MSATDLRGRQREYAAAELERIALALFAARGFAAVSVDEIAAAGGTSQRTFFRYFSSKEDLLLRYERRLHDRFVAALRARPATEGPVTAMRRAFIATSTVATADLPAVRTRARVLADAPALHARARGERVARTTEVADVLAERSGAAAIDDRHRVIAATMTAAAQTAWDAWLAGGEMVNPAERIATALDLIVVGLHALDAPEEDP